ncbi:glycosyltransferase family A protein [Micromonospora sp. NPDC023956]|uniref:glycosyltransferase family 2 protein n=1 Tax=Micromonospora sp. NPDC023956 TaxID=3155722 RepID=UPI00340CE251
MDPLVSVVIPCYNRARTVALCVRSVRRQTYPAIEVVVVDDASADGSGAVAEAAGATVLRLETNSGPGAARNRGAAHARGEILFFLDADVALEPGSVAAAVAHLRSAPGLGAICGVLRPESLLSRKLVAEYRALQMYHWWLAREGPMEGLHTALCAMRAEVFREIGPFNPDLRHTEAPEYGHRIRQRYEVRGTAAIAGVHDHDTTLRVLLPKVFLRARASAAEVRPGEALGGGAAARVLASGLVLAAVLASPLPLVLGPAAVAVPLLLLAVATALEAGTYRRVVVDRGLRFGLRFTPLHLLYQLTSAAGAAVGTGQRLWHRLTWRAGPPVEVSR